MNLVFVSSKKYPEGDAATNRQMAYAKGLVEAGHNVQFILLLKQDKFDSEFIHDGVQYICVYPKDQDNKFLTKIKKPLNSIKSRINGRRTILKIHDDTRIDAIILLSTFLKDLIPFVGIAKNNGIKLLHERTEYPFVFYGNSLKERTNLYIYSSFVLPKLDGLYVINQALKGYFNNLLKNKVPVEIINMVVDPDRFKGELVNPSEKNQYLAYCGTLNSDKDGVDILVEAFCQALKKGKLSTDIKLMLIGDYIDEAFRTTLNNLIEKKKCKDNILFTGKVERLKMPGLLKNAAALALARPDNKQAEGGFPTKLGEYLATGKPVIISEVGEIGYFLKDGENAFIARPGDVESFSEKIHEVFENYSKALEIGIKGRLLVLNEFSYLEQAKKLAGFIGSLNSKIT